MHLTIFSTQYFFYLNDGDDSNWMEIFETALTIIPFCSVSILLGMGWGLQIGAELTEVLLILSSDSAVDAFKSRAQVMNRRTKEEHTCLFQENTYMENKSVARRIGKKCVCVCVWRSQSDIFLVYRKYQSWNTIWIRKSRLKDH